MSWNEYVKRFKRKSRWGQWREWNRLSPVERDYLTTVFGLTPPPPSNGLWTRIGTWPASNILGLWLAECLGLLLSLVLTSQSSDITGSSQFDFPSALSWWLIALVPGVVITWMWIKAREIRRKLNPRPRAKLGA